MLYFNYKGCFKRKQFSICFDEIVPLLLMRPPSIFLLFLCKLTKRRGWMEINTTNLKIFKKGFV